MSAELPQATGRHQCLLPGLQCHPRCSQYARLNRRAEQLGVPRGAVVRQLVVRFAQTSLNPTQRQRSP